MAPGKTRSIVCSARNFFQFTMPGKAWWQVYAYVLFVFLLPPCSSTGFQHYHILVKHIVFISLKLRLSLFVMQLIPRWYEHWTSNLVYDGDMIVLQGQEKVFLSASKESSADVNQQYTKLTFTPTQADRFVLAFRAWLRKFGNSQPDWYGSPSQDALPSTVLSKREVKTIYFYMLMFTMIMLVYFFYILIL
jgi:pheophorbide a oxygenase